MQKLTIHSHISQVNSSPTYQQSFQCKFLQLTTPKTNMDSKQFQITKPKPIKPKQEVVVQTRQASMPRQQQISTTLVPQVNAQRGSSILTNVRQGPTKAILIPQPSMTRVNTKEEPSTPSESSQELIRQLQQQLQEKDQRIQSLVRELEGTKRDLTEQKNFTKRYQREVQGLKALIQNQQQQQQQQQEPVYDENEARSMMLALQLQERERRSMQAMQYYQFMQEALQPRQDPNQIDPDRMTYEQLLELQDKIGHVSRGLTKEQIKRIHKCKITLLNRAKLPDVCSICYSEFKTGEQYRQLKCSHPYHGKCIKQWLLNEKKCPICKEEVNV